MKTRLFLIGLICCYLFLVGCNSHQSIDGVKGKAQKVTDSLIIEVKFNNSFVTERIKLIGIEAPDIKQIPWGLNAKSKLNEWLENEEVILEFGQIKTDKFGRKWAYIWHNGELINEKLIAEGYVLNSLEYEHKYSENCQRAQEYARLMQYGIWDSANPLREKPSLASQKSKVKSQKYYSEDESRGGNKE